MHRGAGGERERAERPGAGRGLEHAVAGSDARDPGAERRVGGRRRELLEVVLLGRAARLRGQERCEALDPGERLGEGVRVRGERARASAQAEVETELGRVVGVAGREGPLGECAAKRLGGEREQVARLDRLSVSDPGLYGACKSHAVLLRSDGAVSGWRIDWSREVSVEHGWEGAAWTVLRPCAPSTPPLPSSRVPNDQAIQLFAVKLSR